MSIEAEFEALKRQNRRLKVALFSTITVLIVGAAMVTAFTATAATRARAAERLARAQAQAALAAAQGALEETQTRGP
jgi:uncharacterized membrane protein (DUF485 family)